MIPAGSSAPFAAAKRFAEQVGALRAIPGHVVAPDRVMMRDGAAGGDQRIGGAGLDVRAIARSGGRDRRAR